MEEGTSQGCLLSPLFASFVVACLLEPIDCLLPECVEILATTAKEVFLTYSALSMTSHPVFTSLTSTFYVHKSVPAVPPFDAS